MSVKAFVNESAIGHRVSNVKFLWRDENRNLGYGVHIDKETASEWLLAIAEIYAPDKWSELFDAFHGKEDRTIKSKTHTLIYTFLPDANDDTRLLLILTNDAARKKDQLITDNKENFEYCMKMVTKHIDYAPSDLIGDREPSESNGYLSFSIKGRDYDLFYCEVFPEDKRFRLKAALKGGFPMKYIDQGTLSTALETSS